MKNFTLYWAIAIILLQLLNLDYDQVFNWRVNKDEFINLMVGLLILIAHFMEKKKSSS